MSPFPETRLKAELRVNRCDFMQLWAGKAAALPELEHPSVSERGRRDRLGSLHVAKITFFSSKNFLLQKQTLGPGSFLPLHTKHPADVIAQLFVQQTLHRGGLRRESLQQESGPQGEGRAASGPRSLLWPPPAKRKTHPRPPTPVQHRAPNIQHRVLKPRLFYSGLIRTAIKKSRIFSKL